MTLGPHVLTDLEELEEIGDLEQRLAQALTSAAISSTLTQAVSMAP